MNRILILIIISTITFSCEKVDYNRLAGDIALTYTDPYHKEWNSGVFNPLFINPKERFSSNQISEIHIIKCPTNYLCNGIEKKYKSLIFEENWKTIEENINNENRIRIYYNKKNYIDSIVHGKEKHFFNHESDTTIVRRTYNDSILKKTTKFKYNKGNQLIEVTSKDFQGNVINKKEYQFDQLGIIQKIKSYDSQFDFENYVYLFDFKKKNGSLNVIKNTGKNSFKYLYLEVKSKSGYKYEFYPKKNELSSKSTVNLDKDGSIKMKKTFRNNEILNSYSREVTPNWEETKTEKKSVPNGYKIVEDVITKGGEQTEVEKLFNAKGDLVYNAFSSNKVFAGDDFDIMWASYIFYKY